MNATGSAATVLTRRAWLQASALVALHAWAATGARAAVPLVARLPADAIVIDAGLPEAATLAQDAMARCCVHLLGDDPAELFYGRLVPAWRSGGVRGLAGLTRAAALFLLEPLAAEYGMRTVALLRAPSAGCASLATLCDRPERRRPTSPEALHVALRSGDEATFAWWMTPVHRPLHAGVTVMPT